MSAEGKPPTESSLLGQPLKLLTVLVARFPISVIIISALLVALSLTGAQLSLGFRTSRSDLLNPASESNRRWAEYTQEFGEPDDVTIVVHSENPQVVPPILDDLAAQLNRQTRLFHSVFHKIDVEKLKSKGLYNDHVDLQKLNDISRFVDQSRGLLQGDLDRGLTSLNIGGQIAWFAEQVDRGDPRQLAASLGAAQEQMQQCRQILTAALGQPGSYRSPLAELSSLAAGQGNPFGSGYKLLNQGHIGLVVLNLGKNDKNGSFTEYSEGLTELRQIVADMKNRHPEAWIGLTGLPVMENDEMESSQAAMAQAGVLSFIGVALLYVAGFGCVRHPTMALVALLVPMGWSFGYILLTVGHLNILSSAFATIVIGLGSDYGVYHIAQYLRYCSEKMSTFDALLATTRSIGVGLTTSAVATALAFFSIGLSDFPGIAELGIIAGGGILLCWLAALTTLPALIHWSDAHRAPWLVPAPLDVFAWLGPLVRRPKLVVAGYALCTILICFGLKDLWYDYNLLNLQAEGLESVKLEKKLLQSDCGASFAVVVAKSREELLLRKAMYANRELCPMVDSVEEIGTYVPAGTAQKRPLIQHIHDCLVNLPPQMPRIDSHIPVVPWEQLEQSLKKLQGLMTAMRQPAEAQQLQNIRDLILNLGPEEYYRRLTTFQDNLAADTLRALYALRSMSNPEPPALTDLPEGLVARFVGHSGHFCIQVHTKADIWNMTEMEEFVRQLRSVDDNLHRMNPAIDTAVTGNPVQVYESSRELIWGYEKGAFYGIMIVIVVVWLDFRNIRMTLLALLPLITSKLQLFGLMGLLGIPLNPANMIVLPLILGIGVDTGVQVVHDYLREPHPYRMNPSTSAALVINTLMNIVGFGALMIASHRGLHSLGRVLTLGMACCLLSCMVMPSLLQLLPDMRPKQRRDEETPAKIDDAGIDLAALDDRHYAQIPVIRRKSA
jgi:predicted RND superfamily exporter protein